MDSLHTGTLMRTASLYQDVITASCGLDYEPTLIQIRRNKSEDAIPRSDMSQRGSIESF